MNIEIDIERARAETRACEDIVHFNNAGASLMPIPVAKALHAYLDKEERIGGYETANEEIEALENFYVATAKLLPRSTPRCKAKRPLLTTSPPPPPPSKTTLATT